MDGFLKVFYGLYLYIFGNFGLSGNPTTSIGKFFFMRIIINLIIIIMDLKEFYDFLA